MPMGRHQFPWVVVYCLLGTGWYSGVRSALFLSLADALQQRTLKLYSTAYSNIAIADLAQALGCDDAQAVSMAQSKGLVQGVDGGYVIWKVCYFCHKWQGGQQ